MNSLPAQRDDNVVGSAAVLLDAEALRPLKR